MSRRHTQHGPSKTRDVTSLVFSFFLCVSLVLELVAIIAYAGFFSKGGFLSVLDEDYYQYTLDDINGKAEYYTLPTGFETSVLEGVFRTEDIRNDVSHYVSNAFAGSETYVPDTTGASVRLVANIEELYANQGVHIDDNLREAIDAYVDDIMDIYTSTTKMPGLDAIARVRNRAVQITLVGVIVLAVLIVVLVIVIRKMHHYGHRALRYVAYATGGAALISAVAPAVLLLSGYYRGLNVSPRFFYHFCVSMVERLLVLCLAGAAVFLVLTIVIIVLISSKRSAVMSRGHRRRH